MEEKAYRPREAKVQGPRLRQRQRRRLRKEAFPGTAVEGAGPTVRRRNGCNLWPSHLELGMGCWEAKYAHAQDED